MSNYSGNTCKRRKRFISKCPNIDIRHSQNFTVADVFNSGSILADGVPFWGKCNDILKRI